MVILLHQRLDHCLKGNPIPGTLEYLAPLRVGVVSAAENTLSSCPKSTPLDTQMTLMAASLG